MSFDFVNPISFWFSVIESVNICSLYRQFWKTCANCRPKNWVCFWKCSLLVRAKNAAVSSNLKIGKTWFQKPLCWNLRDHALFDAVIERRQKRYLRQFSPKTNLVFLRRMKRVCTNGEFASWQTSTTFNRDILQMILQVV